MSEAPSALYRPGIGIALLNVEGRVWVGRRGDIDAWQMPQGGIDPGETARQACLRELVEEVGTDRARIIAESRDWLCYDLPPQAAQRLWGGRYRGQRQKWFALRFTGSDSDIDLCSAAAPEPEFVDWRWVDFAELPSLIAPFKRGVYERVVEEFRHLTALDRD